MHFLPLSIGYHSEEESTTQAEMDFGSDWGGLDVVFGNFG